MIDIRILAQWARKFNIKQPTLRRRIVDGWPMDEAMTGQLKRNKKYSFNHKSQTLPEWSRDLDIGIETLRNRLKSGWSIEKTLTKTVQKQHDRI